MSKVKTSPPRGSLYSALFAAASMCCATGTVFAKPADLTVEAVSNRADLVSGGDVLVRVTLPAGQTAAQAVLALNGQPIPNALHPAPDGKGWLALVQGMPLGANAVTITSAAEVARLDVTNHPNGGPVFSGPQIQPWTCRNGATDALCNRPTTYSYSYMAQGATQFASYDPASPPTNVMQITTSAGVTVPYIVRVETGTQNRDGVAFAVLFNPAQPWAPWAPQSGWNGGVHVLQGAGCGTGFTENAPSSPLNDNALRKGFLVAQIALVNNDHNCNQIVQAEAVVMAKERIVEQYGVFDLIFGQGSSGGAISQLEDTNAYPGLYDGLILNHTFVDSDASRLAAYDCKVVYDHWAKPGTMAFTEAEKESVVGMVSGCNSHVSTTRYQVYNPSVGTSCNVPAEQKFNAVTNPNGVRCTLQDYQVNQVGRRPDGWANGRLDNVGLQYGLKALMRGAITPAQFAELNANIGGHDINFNRTTTRTVADRAGLKAMYWSGINNMTSNLSETAILEMRIPATDFHQVFHAYVVRARLDRAQGHHNNHVQWRTLQTGGDPALTNAAFDTMVQWIKAIKADTRAVPKAQKVVDNKPALAHDRCTLGDGVDQPASVCPRPLELTRVLAGAPDTTDVGKCQLKPLNAQDYLPVTFTAAQWQSLQQTFPSGVCDFSKPLVDLQMTIPWMTYEGVRGKAMPPAPQSYDGRTTQRN